MSRSTRSKLRPSQRLLLDLYTIMEDEVDDYYNVMCPDSSDDNAPFDRLELLINRNILLAIYAKYFIFESVILS